MDAVIWGPKVEDPKARGTTSPGQGVNTRIPEIGGRLDLHAVQSVGCDFARPQMTDNATSLARGFRSMAVQPRFVSDRSRWPTRRMRTLTLQPELWRGVRWQTIGWHRDLPHARGRDATVSLRGKGAVFRWRHEKGHQNASAVKSKFSSTRNFGTVFLDAPNVLKTGNCENSLRRYLGFASRAFSGQFLVLNAFVELESSKKACRSGMTIVKAVWDARNMQRFRFQFV